ncbi:MAG: tRNA (N(6)-L-threonylcarbamoyladenosine(37)-C(2))-methylthiotransferase MtaB [Defluviitaleaceae bacterium]|nr:tRNA (N(6)-L-threonylcarbamoyladenosine(37)-C(2))-methylthiotransferase MtaB [Defluviitaleaceae bacterium]MCL2274867.1 tRNA (N(6)-L-threonylcarbamoyladenosine(37)-C(2))-methylthiotransferase MtaB [Defluviitaleaceae bacterium]
MLTFALHTLGCKVNQCDADALSAKLREAGYRVSAFSHPTTDIYIINTCTITHVVDKKSMQYIRRARRANPVAFVAVCGCMASKAPTIAEANLVFDTRKPEALLDALASWRKTYEGEAVPVKSGSVPALAKTRAFLKVQDGCDCFCAYCIVPYVRGTPVSVPLEEVMQNAACAIQKGAKEIVLTGIQLAAYGKNTATRLPELIRRVGALPNLQRLRLSSLDPWAVDKNFLRAVEETPAICDHFHLSLQSGSAPTLKNMNRTYTPEDYANAVARLRKIYPTTAITTDIIVGFPQETEADHAESMNFIREMRLARLHVFPYSPRAGTKAAEMAQQVPAAVKKARMAQMLSLAAELENNFLDAQVGIVPEVLPESEFKGFTRNYCTVRTPFPLTVNAPTRIRVARRENDILIGELL